jgi:hypothetical protein
MDNSDKYATKDVSQIETSSGGDASPIRAITRLPVPDLIRDLSEDERQKLNLRLKRKVDLRLLPMVVIMYILNYLDRNNIAAARFAGLEQELKLKGNQFQVGRSFYTQACCFTVVTYSLQNQLHG